MNDRRVFAIRNALEALIEAVDATNRIVRWTDVEPIPDSLRQAASQLEACKKSANELVLDKVSGTPAIVHKLSTSSTSIRRLSAASDEFLSCRLDHANDVSTACQNLDAAIDSANEILRSLE